MQDPLSFLNEKAEQVRVSTNNRFDETMHIVVIIAVESYLATSVVPVLEKIENWAIENVKRIGNSKEDFIEVIVFFASSR